MQLRKTVMMLTALSALSVVMTGCPGDEERSLTCATDAECIEGEICHPTAKACVQTCATNDDCSTRKCEAVSSSVATKVCKCSTDQLCTSDFGTELVCSTLDTVCTSKCTSDAACGTGRTCDTATGQCKAGGGNTGDTCTGEGQATCSYGQFCSASKCTAVSAPTCANFNPQQGGKTPVWNATSSTGPIIFETTQVSFAADSFCSGDATPKLRVKAYTSTGTFPASKDNLNGLFYVRVNGTEVNGKDLIRPSEYSVSADGKTATFTMNFCPGASATALSVGLYFTGGNETCAQLTKP
jgi:hypothetical protein